VTWLRPSVRDTCCILEPSTHPRVEVLLSLNVWLHLMKKLIIAIVSLATTMSGAPALAGGAFVTRPFVPMTMSVPMADVQTVGCNNMTNCPSLNPRWGRHDRHEGRRHHGRDRHSWNRNRRHHNRSSNAGAILGGLAAGAIIGGIVSSQANAGSYGSHADYCRAKYRSYRVSDNSFQPYNGPRRQCR
jgi:BA14K-like protein